ncbi:helix-turn-helix transcriptional regulator [Micromonospora sp. SCSIO 07396]
MTNHTRSDLAMFLRSRRERIMPAHVGLPVGPRRRTPGLRREEIAMLAGLSPTWYTYLEQGRDIRPSPEVLDSLARVLQLSEDERRYLHLLAVGEQVQSTPTQPRDLDKEMMRQAVALIGQVDLPVYAADVYGDMVAWNAATTRWYTDFETLPPGRRNMLWWLLTAPEARSRLVKWEEDTRDVVGRFRAASATRPWDQRFRELITAMQAVSPEFCTWWPEHDVRGQQIRPRHLRLPTGESLTTELVVLRMADSFFSLIMHIDPGTTAAPTEVARRVLCDNPEHYVK